MFLSCLVGGRARVTSLASIDLLPVDPREPSDTSEASCTICFSAMNDPATLLPCGHSFCRACITNWVRRKISCPLCREVPIAMLPFESSKYTRCMVLGSVDGAPKRHAGITLRDHSRTGVVVDGVCTGDEAHRVRLRRGDVILAINGIGAGDHASVVRMLDTLVAREGGGTAMLQLSTTEAHECVIS